MLIVGLYGCAEITRNDADRVLDDNVWMLAEVEARLESIESLVTPQPTAHLSGDGDYEYGGALYPISANFTDGHIAVIGTGSSAGNGSTQRYDLRLTYTEVLRDGTRYDGAVSTQMAVDLVDGEVTVSYTVKGALTTTGAVEVEADMDWTYAASSADGAAPHYTGIISGRDVGN